MTSKRDSGVLASRAKVRRLLARRWEAGAKIEAVDLVGAEA